MVEKKTNIKTEFTTHITKTNYTSQQFVQDINKIKNLKHYRKIRFIFLNVVTEKHCRLSHSPKLKYS